MSVVHLILQEARHRSLSSLLSLSAIVVAVALPVLYFTTGEAAKRETTRLMRDIGYNLRIIPRAADLGDFWRLGYAGSTMPETAVHRFAAQSEISYNHVIAMLQRDTEWRGTPVLVTGIAPEIAPRGKKKSPMTFAVERGTLVAGSEVTASLSLERDQTVDFLGRSFRVAQCLTETGSRDDIRVWLHLEDAQELLGEPGRINEIKALECYCKDPTVDNLERLRGELERIVPQGRVLRIEALAEAREKQRRMSERYFAFLLPIVLLACALWIGFLATLNVRERAAEIGILHALGHGWPRIGALFLGKALVLGLAGAAIGFGIGTLVALGLGPQVFATRAGQVRPLWWLLPVAAAAAPLFAAVCSLIPTVLAVTRDPATLLREAERA